jgi:hypothetical protein
MTRGLVVLTVLAAFASGALIGPGGPAGAQLPGIEPLTLDPGDRVRVDGVGIGCRVTRLSQYGGRTFLDCRRSGPLAGTYATLLGEREIAVIRFVKTRTAKVVFAARHRGGHVRCE